MKLLAFIILLIQTAHFAPVNNPVSVTWKMLSNVKFTRKYNKEVEMYFMYPTFGAGVKQLNGKQIQIKGYLIPVDETGNIYVISAQPMAMCYFCGGAGPESIIELQFRNKNLRFKTDQVKTITGRLQLNPDRIEHLNYIVKDAQVIGE